MTAYTAICTTGGVRELCNTQIGFLETNQVQTASQPALTECMGCADIIPQHIHYT